MKLNRTLALILAVCMMLAVLAGCGGSKESAAPESTAPESTAPESTTPDDGAEESDVPELAFPDGFPKKEITLIVPFAAGGAFDVMARNVQAIAQEMYGVNIIVSCVSGGGSAVGVTQVLTSNPDGYTIGFGSTSYLGLIAQGQMDASVDDADFLCQISADPMVLIAKAGGEYDTLDKYLDAAKANPGTVTLGNPGTNNTNQATAKFLDMAMGEGTFDMLSYSDGDSRVVTELLGGHLDAGVLKPNSCMSQILSGELVIIGSFTEERLEAFPDVPTFAEYDLNVFPYGDVAQTVCFAIAPAGLDPEIKTFLSDLLHNVVMSDKFQELAATNGFEAPGTYGDEITTYVTDVLFEGAKVLAEKVFAVA